MSQANWSEYIGTRPTQAAGERRRPALRWPAWLTDWESWLTFALVLMVFMSVARSIDNAAWVARMPSLLTLSFLGLCTGLALARVRVPEVILHLLALAIGALVVFWLTLQFIDAPTVRESFTQFRERWSAWIAIVRASEPVTDNMPFVMLLLALTWIAAYLASWSIFRWRNAWLALIPGGVALLTNISYLPSQFSVDFVIFLFGAMLLVMRVHLINRQREWRRTNTPYPDFISFRLLNATTWVAIAALIFAWSAPQANEVGVFARMWERVSAPFTTESDGFVRLFSSIDSKREVPLHSFGDTLPFQGRVVLGSRIAAQVEFGEASNEGRPLRAKVYDEYTPTGWKSGTRAELDVPATEPIPMPGNPNPRPAYRDRVEVTANYVMESGLPKNALPSIGQPGVTSVNSRAELIGAEPIPDVDVVRSRQKFKVGDDFTTTGTISVASEERLRASGDAYPQYVRDRYLQLPATLPPRVRQLASDLTKDRTTAFDKAKAMEEYLRTFPPTYDIRAVPPGRDAIDFFLFDERKGYSDYQASAMVVLLRASGVPARLAVGYVVDEFDVSVRRYLLRDKHAYAWPEVFFAGLGWVEFAPYGDAPQISRPVDDAALGDTAASSAAGEGGESFPDFGEQFDDFGASGGALASTSTPLLERLLPVLYVLLGLLVLAAVGGLGLRVAWERGMAGLDYPSQLWEKTTRLATWLRIGPRPEQTPTEFSRALGKTLPDAADGVSKLAQGYQRARYGRRDLSPAEQEQLTTAWTPLRNQMVKRLLRWKS